MSTTPRAQRHVPTPTSPVPRASRLVPLLLAVALTAACQPAEETPEPADRPVRVENAQVGIVIADVPDFFRVEVEEGDRLVLVPADPAVAGELTVVAREPGPGGVNLLAAVEEHEAELAELPDGEFKGQRELGVPLGAAYYSRGRFTEGDATVEETRVFLVHPWGDRRLDVIYRYPAGDDSAQRLQEQLFVVVGEIEGLPAEPRAAGDEAAAEETGP